MKRAALAVILVAASTPATAGTYVGLGIGTGPAIHTDDPNDIGSVGRSARLLAGSRWGRFSVEGALGGFDARYLSNNDPLEIYQLSVAGKYNLPLSDGFEAYGRAGLQRTWLGHENPDIDAVGTGFLLGGGIEYRVNLGASGGSIFLDYQLTSGDLESDLRQTSTELTTRMWTIGATIGF